METGLFSKTLSFAELYYAMRDKEGRIYSDEQVVNLPNIDKNHPHYKEWQIRKSSYEKLNQYIQSEKNPVNLLDVGCGNGWLSARLAKAIPGKVTALDIHSPEIEQASRVFQNSPNLQFVQGNLYSPKLLGKKYDLILFAASIQYFTSLCDVLNSALAALNDGGEIHIIDSFFYKPDEIEAARQRTLTYYAGLGVPEMSNLYFHHNEDELKNFKAEILYNPKSIINKLIRTPNPFPWIRIRK